MSAAIIRGVFRDLSDIGLLMIENAAILMNRLLFKNDREMLHKVGVNLINQDMCQLKLNHLA